MRVLKLQPETILPPEVGKCLRTGGVIAHATETVYGLACRWDNAASLARVAQIKQRDPDQPYSLLVNSVDEIVEMIGWQTERLQQLLTLIYPAPVTLLLPRRKLLPVAFWNNYPLLGFRLPDDALCRALVASAGAPLITTSANLSGSPPPVSATELASEIAAAVDYVLDSGKCEYQTPSTIIRLDENLEDYQIVRKGAFSTDLFQKRLQNLN